MTAIAHQMLSGLTGHFHIIDRPECVIKFLSVRFVPALHKSAPRWKFTVLRRDPLHFRSDGQQIVPPVVFSFGPAVCDAARGLDGGCDHARVNRVFEDRRAYVHGGHPVGLHASRRPDLFGRRELSVRSQWDTESRWRGDVPSRRRRLTAVPAAFESLASTTIAETSLATAVAVVVIAAVECAKEPSRFRDLLWRVLEDLGNGV
jgi:hypothetical protein